MSRFFSTMFVWFILLAVTAQAIEITINLKLSNQHPDYAKLLNVLEAAADTWEDLVPGNRIFNDWEFYYEDFGDPNKLFTVERLAPPADSIVEIRLNTKIDWFFDSTPKQHEEFIF